MGRLIDVDKFKAINKMKDDCADCDKELRGTSKACEFDRVYTKMDFCGWLDDAPTVEAVPVRHGRWQWISSTYDRVTCEKRYRCSKCHHETITHDSEPWEKFCPNCGARMDGKESSEK